MTERSARSAGDWLSELESEDRDRFSLSQTKEGVFGLDTVVEDFDEDEIERLRRIGEAIRTLDREGVKSAVALAGSAAQSKFQLFPGDCDFFERIHIVATTREAALAILASVMIETVGRVFSHPDLKFAEMKLGTHPRDGRRGDDTFRTGSPVSWSLADLDARSIPAEDADGVAYLIDLGEVAGNPGFVKIDWVMADREKDRIVAVSKAIDATWEAPDGSIVALDGVLDSFYQEVYLDPETRPHVERLIDKAKPSGLREYVDQLDREIAKYTDPAHANWAKVAKRLYNIFRITNRPEPAMFLRQLFDDPAAHLYQVPAGLHALEQILGTRHLDEEVVNHQIEEMANIVRDTYLSEDADDVIASLRSLPTIGRDKRQAVIDEIREKVEAEVSGYFEARLREETEIMGYIALAREEA
jgi:hypothetical protein